MCVGYHVRDEQVNQLIRRWTGDPNARPRHRQVDFAGRVSEAQLEAWLIEHPDLAGEPLLVLGSQLAEFAEYKDRLDVLAVDETGELVLIELKVDESFRVTDLQALAYAGAYASIPNGRLAGVLCKQLEKQGIAGASAEMAQDRIADFGAPIVSDRETRSASETPSSRSAPDVVVALEACRRG